LYVASQQTASGDTGLPGAGVIVLQWLRFQKLIRNNKLALDVERFFWI